ncbi:TPA: NTP transferase domain-containing protein, partial [archaeon]|nr:NTP transferase domain-containing protein [Candidatus Naiadarchaeales archaeon SRR2090153.bin461]
MQAVILAGGLGTRLRPLTYETPKPMVNVLGKPFLEHLVGMLKEKG